MSGKKTDLNKTRGRTKPEASAKNVKTAEEKSAPQTKSATKATTAKTAEPVKSAAKKPAAKSAPKTERSPEKAAASEGKKKAPAKQTKGVAKAAAAGKEQKKAPASKAEAKSRKTPSAKKQEAAEPSSKTPQVMKLVDQKNDMINPTIMAGKSSIPRSLRGLEPLSRIIKREAEEVFGGDAETYNLTALVIEEHAPEILRRFNACDCEICVETLSRLTADKVPARFAKLRRSTVERDLEEVRQLKDPLRRPVTSHMVRLVMQNKKRSYHD